MHFNAMDLKRGQVKIGMYFLMLEEVKLKEHPQKYFLIKSLITLQVAGIQEEKTSYGGVQKGKKKFYPNNITLFQKLIFFQMILKDFK